MNFTVISPPPYEPVPLTTIYKHLRLTPDHQNSPGEETHPDDAILRGYRTSAREDVESATGRSLVQQTIRGSFAADELVKLFHGPVVSVSSVSYYDSSNVLTVVDSANYYVTDELVPEVRFVTAYAAPTTYDRPDAIRVEFSAGYVGDGSPPTSEEEYSANVPQSLKDAILLGIQILYDDISDQDRAALERCQSALMSQHVIRNSP